jgi:ubiquinone/menaquinone biosynthesis C-methylase UbiE
MSASDHGTLIERAGLYEFGSAIAYLGRRRAVYGRIVALSGARPGDRVLDIGCNGGFLARLLAAQVGPDGHVVGIDPAEQAIRYASRRAPANAAFTVGVAQDLALPDSSFDVVTSTLAVHHIPQDLQAAAFGEMYRVLRPGGRLLVADFRPPKGPLRLLHPKPGGMHDIDPDRLDGQAEAAGFRVKDRGDLFLLRYVLAVRPG